MTGVQTCALPISDMSSGSLDGLVMGSRDISIYILFEVHSGLVCIELLCSTTVPLVAPNLVPSLSPIGF